MTCSDQGRVGPEEGVGTSSSLPQDTEQEALQCCPHNPSDLTPDVLFAGGQPAGSQSSRAQGSGVTARAPSPFTRGLGAGSAGVSSRARGSRGPRVSLSSSSSLSPTRSCRRLRGGTVCLSPVIRRLGGVGAGTVSDPSPGPGQSLRGAGHTAPSSAGAGRPGGLGLGELLDLGRGIMPRPPASVCS